MRVSQRFEKMEPSSVRKLSKYADAAIKQGKKVYHLNIGQPDLATPLGYFERIRQFDQKTVAYMPSLGTSELIDSISHYYASLGMKYGRGQIAVTCGGTEAVLFSLLATMDPGDEVIVTEPFYSNYNTLFTIAGVTCISVPTYAERGFHFTREELENNITERTKAILLSNPGNPTGAVLRMEEVQFIADLASERDLYIIADEVYREYVFDDRPISSFGYLPDIADRLIITDSVSKRYNACGARIGALLTKNRSVFSVVEKLCQGRLACSTIEQHAVAALFRTGPDYIQRTRQEYQDRRDIIIQLLDQMPGVVCKKPEGAFYMIVKLPVDDATAFLTWLLADFSVAGETVMAAPADGFYKTSGLGKDEIRIAYVLEKPELQKAMTILKKGLNIYQSISGK